MWKQNLVSLSYGNKNNYKSKLSLKIYFIFFKIYIINSVLNNWEEVYWLKYDDSVILGSSSEVENL